MVGPRLLRSSTVTHLPGEPAPAGPWDMAVSALVSPHSVVEALVSRPGSAQAAAPDSRTPGSSP